MVVSLGHFDIATTIMTMSSFRVAPHQGHLDHLKRIHTLFRTHEPDYSDLPECFYAWTSIYSDVWKNLQCILYWPGDTLEIDLEKEKVD